jgi:hypothetical protein
MSVTSVWAKISLNAALHSVKVHFKFICRELIYSLETEGAAVDTCKPCSSKSIAYWQRAPHGVI